MDRVPRVNMLNIGCGVFTYSSPAHGVDPLKVTWLLENFDTRLRRISFDLRGKRLIDALTEVANWALETTFKKKTPPKFFENLIDDLVLITLARRSGYSVKNARDAENIIDFDSDGYPIGVKDPNDASNARALGTNTNGVAGRAHANGVQQNGLDTQVVDDPIELSLLGELVSAMEGFDYTVIQNGQIRFGSELQIGKRYVLLNGRETVVLVDNGVLNKFSVKHSPHGKMQEVEFEHTIRSLPIKDPLVLIRTKHSPNEDQVSNCLSDYTFIPGDRNNYQLALDNLRENDWYKVTKKRTPKPDVSFIGKYKTCIENPRGNLILFFRNGRCLELFGKIEHTITLQEVEISL